MPELINSQTKLKSCLKQGNSTSKHIKWEENTIREHDALRGTRMTIDELPTPFVIDESIDIEENSIDDDIFNLKDDLDNSNVFKHSSVEDLDNDFEKKRKEHYKIKKSSLKDDIDDISDDIDN